MAYEHMMAHLHFFGAALEFLAAALYQRLYCSISVGVLVTTGLVFFPFSFMTGWYG